MDRFFVTQLIGFIALGFFILSFQFDKRHTILKFQIWAASIYAVHLLLLGAYTGSIMSIIAAIRNTIYSKYKGTKYRLLLPTSFIIIFIVAGIVTWQGPLSLLPLCTSIVGAIAYWQKSPKVIRFVELFSTPLLLLYNIGVGSYPGIIIEILFFASVVIGVYRFDIRGGKRKAPQGLS